MADSRLLMADDGLLMADGGSVMADGGSVMADGGSVMADGGSVKADGGSVMADGGSVMADGGSVMADGGSVMADGGTVMADGGLVMADGGSVMADGGSVMADGGSIMADGGSVMADGGSVRGGHCFSEKDVKTFLTTKPYGYLWPIETCLLMRAWNYNGFINFNGTTHPKFYGRTGSGSHAEVQALNLLENYLKDHRRDGIKIRFIINYSPCVVCTHNIKRFLKKYDQIVHFEIVFAGLYTDWEIALKELIHTPRMTVRNIASNYWLYIIRARGEDESPKALQQFPQALGSSWQKLMQNELKLRQFSDYNVETFGGRKISILSKTFLTARENSDKDTRKKIDELRKTPKNENDEIEKLAQLMSETVNIK